MRQLILFILLFSLAACDDSPTSPSASARVEAVIQDTPSGAVLTGTLAGNVFASVGDTGRWVDIGSANGITVPLQTAGRTTTVHGEASVAPGTYNRVRLVLQGVTARLAAGSRIGDRVLTSDTNVSLGGGDQRAEVVVSVDSFVLESDATVRRLILFELRSHQWLTAAAVQAGRVEDAELQGAFTANTRSERR